MALADFAQRAAVAYLEARPAGTFAVEPDEALKPSIGLEPMTPSLPWKCRRVLRVRRLAPRALLTWVSSRFLGLR